MSVREVKSYIRVYTNDKNGTFSQRQMSTFYLPTVVRLSQVVCYIASQTVSPDKMDRSATWVRPTGPKKGISISDSCCDTSGFCIKIT